MAEGVQECPAYEICRGLRTACDVCMGLEVPAWRKHVKKVLKRGANGIR